MYVRYFVSDIYERLIGNIICCFGYWNGGKFICYGIKFNFGLIDKR